MDRAPMTRQGYEQLREKLQRLKEVDLPDAQAAIGRALEHGDVSENSELDAARERAGLTERQILELEQQLSLAEVIEKSQMPTDVVAIGATVQLEDLKRGGTIDYMLVGEGEIRDDMDTVSVSSPLGRALVGHKAGEEVEFQGPRGALRYRIVSFRYE